MQTLTEIFEQRGVNWFRDLLSQNPNYFAFAANVRKAFGGLSFERISAVYQFVKAASWSGAHFSEDESLEIRDLKTVPLVQEGRMRTVVTAELEMDCSAVGGRENLRVRATIRLPGTPSRAQIEGALVDFMIAATISDQERFSPYEECQLVLVRYLSIFQTF